MIKHIIFPFISETNVDISDLFNIIVISEKNWP